MAAAARTAHDSTFGWCEKCSRRRMVALKCSRCSECICPECVFRVEVKERLCIRCQIEEDYGDEI